MDKKNTPCWSSCPDCQGQGKKSQRLRKKVRLQYQQLVAKLTAAGEVALPEAPKAPLVSCSLCGGSGLISSKAFPVVDAENYPHISIIGGGIGGVALAVACLHRGIPFTLFERDTHFEARSQGYGLTLQQASKAIEGFGIFSLTEGVVSTRHLVHKTDGTVVGEWGMRKWVQPTEKKYTKRSNIHIARQALRLALVEQLGGKDNIQWGHQLLDFQEEASGKIQLRFQVGAQIKTIATDLVVGADGIRSVVRQQLIGEEVTPLRYLGCLVILGICPLDALPTVTSALLDSATVFQTANGHERIYIMPFTEDSVMWQLSFPMEESEAKKLSAQGAQALKEEASRRTQWHSPIPQIVDATAVAQVSGYPVYDRTLLTTAQFENAGNSTLIGDAAHPMSPFKGQGANQALLDALALARGITKGCKPSSQWRTVGLRKSVLLPFEAEMIARSAIKVKDSAAAAEFLHSDIVLYESDEPRGRILKRKKQ